MRILFFGFLLISCSHLYAQHLVKPIPAASKYGEVCAKSADLVQIPRLTYPKAALDEKLAGWAIVRYDISEGKATNVVLAESSSPIFDAPSVAATKSMEFQKKSSLNGCAVAFHFDMD